jgi:acetyl-CoA carboxylase biotin carboxyl carrier protein
MNLKELKELLELLRNSEVTELEIEKAGVRVRIKKERAPSEAPLPSMPPAPPAVESAGAKESPKAERTVEPEGKVTVTAPVVGIFYRAPAPDADPYVEVGSPVKKGQVVCVIEAMKLMNEIEAESDGTIAAILVENAQPVEYGQALFLIDPASPAS